MGNDEMKQEMIEVKSEKFNVSMHKKKVSTKIRVIIENLFIHIASGVRQLSVTLKWIQYKSYTQQE